MPHLHVHAPLTEGTCTQKGSQKHTAGAHTRAPPQQHSHHVDAGRLGGLAAAEVRCELGAHREAEGLHAQPVGALFQRKRRVKACARGGGGRAARKVQVLEGNAERAGQRQRRLKSCAQPEGNTERAEHSQGSAKTSQQCKQASQTTASKQSQGSTADAPWRNHPPGGGTMSAMP